MVVLRSLLFTSVLFLACWFSPADAGKHHGGNSGLETLLTTGVIAKVLQNNKKCCGHHHDGGRSAGQYHADPHYQGRSPMMAYPVPMMPAYPQPMMPAYPQPVMYNPQQPAMYNGQQAQMVPQQIPPSTSHSSQVIQNRFSDFEPKDKIEVIRL